MKMNYLSAGASNGKVVVLLHGYPQTSYSWRFVIPLLVEQGYRVIAPDLPGLGDSEIPDTGFDKKNIAAIIHGQLEQLGIKEIYLVGHDWGASVAYSYAAQYRDKVKKLVLLDVPPVGEYMEKLPLLNRNGPTLWWFAFHQVSQLPEILIAGKEKEYISWFFNNSSFNKAVFDKTAIQEYTRTYSQPEKFQAGLNYYRTVLQDITDNTHFAKEPLSVEVLTIGGEQGLGNLSYNMTRHLANSVKGAIIPNCGHYIQEEQPVTLAKELAAFFGE